MTQRIRGVLSPVVTPFKADLSPDKERFIAHCKWLLTPELRARRVRHQQRSELARRGRTLDAARRPHRGRRRCLAHDARHRLLLDHRNREAHVAGGQARLRRRVDAAAVLLQGCQRRRSLPPLQRSRAARRRCAAQNLSLSHPARRGRRHHAGPGRAFAQSLPQRDRRHERQLGRLEQHQSVPRRVRENRIRRVRRQRILPAREHATQRRRHHFRDGQRQPGRHPQAVYRNGRTPTPTSSRRRSTSRAMRSARST